MNSAMACFKHQPQGTEKNHKHYSCYICLPGVELNLQPPEFKARVLTAEKYLSLEKMKLEKESYEKMWFFVC